MCAIPHRSKLEDEFDARFALYAKLDPFDVKNFEGERSNGVYGRNGKAIMDILLCNVLAPES